MYRTPGTSRVGEAHVAETQRAVDALNGARIVFEGDEDGCVLVGESDLDEPDLEEDVIKEFAMEPDHPRPAGLNESLPDVDMAAGSSNDEVAGDFAEVFQLPTVTALVKKMK